MLTAAVINSLVKNSCGNLDLSGLSTSTFMPRDIRHRQSECRKMLHIRRYSIPSNLPIMRPIYVAVIVPATVFFIARGKTEVYYVDLFVFFVLR